MNISNVTRIIALCGLLAATLPVRAQLYSERNIDLAGWSDFFPTAINGFGKATGSATPDNVHYHAFLWNGTTTQDLGTLGGTQSFGSAINATGNVTGSSYLTGDVMQHAYLWNGTTMKDLGTLGGSNSAGTAINAAGEITGWSDTSGDVAQHAFLWNGTTMKDLGTIGGTDSYGLAINDSGEVAGTSEVTGNAHSHVFLWNGASMKDLGTGTIVGPLTSVAMNNAGQVAGTAYNSSGSVASGFLWDGSKVVNLNTLTGAIYSGADALNAKGEVTGWVQLSTDKKIHSYLWNGTKVTRLDVNTTSDTEFTFCDEGASISSSTGQITGITCEEGGLNFPYFWNGFAMIDLANLVVPADSNLDLGFSTPLINNQGQILDGPFMLSPIPGAIALNIAQPYTIPGCQNVAGFVSSSTPAPSGGLTISLSDTLAAASVPATVKIPAGAIGATFTLSTMPVTSVQSGTVTATLGGHHVSQDISIRPMGVSALTLTPSTVVGGKSVAGKVTLECGAAPAAVTVTLSSNNADASPVPSTISIPRGQSSATFNVTTKNVSTRVLVTIQGSANGIAKSANLKLNK